MSEVQTPARHWVNIFHYESDKVEMLVQTYEKYQQEITLQNNNTVVFMQNIQWKFEWKSPENQYFLIYCE